MTRLSVIVVAWSPQIFNILFSCRDQRWTLDCRDCSAKSQGEGSTTTPIWFSAPLSKNHIYSAGQCYTSMEQFPLVTPEEKLYWQSTICTSILAQSSEGNSGLVLGQSNHPSSTQALTWCLFSCRITGERWRRWRRTCPSPNATVIL